MVGLFQLFLGGMEIPTKYQQALKVLTFFSQGFTAAAIRSRKGNRNIFLFLEQISRSQISLRFWGL